MSCIICEEDKKIKSFLVKQKIQEEVWLGNEKTASFRDEVWFEKEFKINRDICEDCYKPESLSCRKGFIYHVSMEPYAKDFKRKFWDTCKFKKDEILDMNQVVDILVEKGILNTTLKGRHRRKPARAWIKVRGADYLFKMDAPDGNDLRLQKTLFILRKDFEVLLKLPRDVIDGVRQISYMANSKHKLSEEKLNELNKEGWVRFATNGEPRFANHLIKKKRCCVRCGLIKNWDDFRDHKAGNVWECLDCERARAKKYYVENKEKFLALAKTPEAKKRRRELEKNPKYIYARRIRRRLKDYMKTALGGKSPSLWNKKTQVTSKQLVELLEDLSEDWMNENNYGAGSNLDHEGAWHIDHLIPLCLWEEHKHVNPFYKEGDEEIGPNHWSNLRPLCAQENMSRNSRDLDLDEVKSHYEKLKGLYPERFKTHDS